MRSLFLRKTFLQVIALSLSIFFLVPASAFANTLTLTPDSGSYSIGKTIPVTVYVSSPGESVNAVSGTLSFPTDKLQAVSASKAGSILTLWVSDPEFSNSAGTVSFEGVVPNPGFQGASGKIVTVFFKVIGSGTATVKWNSGSVLANDGSGTNILKNLNTATYTLSGSAPVDIVPVVDVPVVVPKPASGSVVITSSTYPDQRKWYSVTDGKFSWKMSENVTAVKVLASKLSNSTPTVVYDPPIDQKEIKDIEDGVWYLHVQPKTAAGYGPVSHFEFRVDSTPPESFVIKPAVSEDGTDPKPKFNFIATDSTSGIDHYTVAIDDKAPVVWRDDGSGVYQVPDLDPGKHSLLAKAYDEAGNSTPASTDFLVTGIDAPKITYYSETVKASGALLVKGTTLPNGTVEITLAKDGVEPLVRTVKADGDGVFTTAVDTAKLQSGAYDLTAVAMDDRGARSERTAPKTVLINASWLQTVGSTLVSALAVAVPVVALLILLAIALMNGFHRVRMTNRRFGQELQNVERLVDKAFALLKEDVEDSVRLLERTKNRRRLTEEEDAIVERLRVNLRDAEKVIHGEIRKIDREL
jgi:hypothetical protein